MSYSAPDVQPSGVPSDLVVDTISVRTAHVVDTLTVDGATTIGVAGSLHVAGVTTLEQSVVVLLSPSGNDRIQMTNEGGVVLRLQGEGSSISGYLIFRNLAEGDQGWFVYGPAGLEFEDLLLRGFTVKTEARLQTLVVGPRADGSLLQASASLTNAAGAATGTLTNAPIAGNPTKWITIDDNGTPRRIPTW